MIKNLTYRQLEAFKTIADEQLGGPFAKGRDKMVRDLISDSSFSLTNAETPYNSGSHPFLIYSSKTRNIEIVHCELTTITKDGYTINRIIFENGDFFDDDFFDDDEYSLDILAIVI